jgi:chromosome segregation ATPase
MSDHAAMDQSALVADLTSQVQSLNKKLVASFEQIGDLEEELDRTSGSRQHLLKRVSQLDSERKQWEERVEGGLLVEKASLVLQRATTF